MITVIVKELLAFGHESRVALDSIRMLQALLLLPLVVVSVKHDVLNDADETQPSDVTTINENLILSDVPVSVDSSSPMSPSGTGGTRYRAQKRKRSATVCGTLAADTLIWGQSLPETFQAGAQDGLQGWDPGKPQS